MKKLIVMSLLLSFNSFADISGSNEIVSGSKIAASDFNSIFSQIKNKLMNKDYLISFETFNKGEIISKNKIVQEINKIPLFIEKERRQSFLSDINSGNLNTVFNFLKTEIDSYESIFLKYANHYDPVCNCFKDIPYSDPNFQWMLDSKNVHEGKFTLDIYIPSTPNGKVVFYSHEMNNNKNMTTVTEIDLSPTRTDLLNKGYYFISVEFRHPILDKNVALYEEDWYDLSKALTLIRKHFHDFKLSNPNDIYSLSYSKGSLILSNILSNDYRSSDRFGKHTFKKMYVFEGQITYHFDSYHTLFISPLNCLGIIPSKTCFNDVNNAAQSLAGFSLTQRTDMIDTYLLLKRNNIIVNPKIRMGYVNAAKTTLEPADGLTIGQTSVGYFLHNPRGINVFCSNYLYAIGRGPPSEPCEKGPNENGTCLAPTNANHMCSGITSVNNMNLLLTDVVGFFEMPNDSGAN